MTPACTGMFQVVKEEQRERLNCYNIFLRIQESEIERDLAKECSKPGCCRNSFEYIRGPLRHPVEGHSVKTEHLLMPLQHPEIAFLPRTSAIGTVFKKLSTILYLINYFLPNTPFLYYYYHTASLNFFHTFHLFKCWRSGDFFLLRGSRKTS